MSKMAGRLRRLGEGAGMVRRGGEGLTVKYMLLIHSNPVNWEALSEAERSVLAAEYAALDQALQESGQLIVSAALADPVNTTTVRVHDGVVATTDGPFAEAKEHLAGWFLVECETPEQAVAIAMRMPDARYNAVEVRPVMDYAGLEM